MQRTGDRLSCNNCTISKQWKNTHSSHLFPRLQILYLVVNTCINVTFCVCRYNYGKNKDNADDLNNIIIELLSQKQQGTYSIIDRQQPYIREFLLRDGSQPSIVAYLDQTLKDLERFCVGKMKCSVPLAVDTTFNISRYYFTQTAYKNVSLVSKETGKHPWFPGPLLVHRSKTQEEFQYFWQAVKRNTPELKNIGVIGTDEETAVYNGILSECDGETVHLLGVEHVKANVERKLDELKFPNPSKRRIISDIFGEASAEKNESLHDCVTEGDFLEKVSKLKKEWNAIEVSSTRNNPPKFVSYFETHKEDKIRQCMVKYVREKAGVQDSYGQNPIEWSHFMSKKEIDDAVKSEGLSHTDAPLATSLGALKARNIRLYSNAIKALYREGPYRVSKEFEDHQYTYDEWKDMSTERKENSIRHFLNAHPQKNSFCKTPTKTSSAPIEQDTAQPNVNVNLLNEQQQLSDHSPDLSILVGDLEDVTSNSNVHRKVLSIAAEEACLPEECIRLGTLQQIFHKAEFLMNEPGAIKEAASDDSRFRTVKSQSGGTPLIVRPVNKKSNLFTCECSTFKGVGICADTVAVAETQDLLFDYLSDLRAKFTRQKGKKKNLAGVNITAAIETGLKVSQKGHKPNEIGKKVQRRSKKNGAKESFSSTCTTKPAVKKVAQTATTTGFEHEITTSSHQSFTRMDTTYATPKQVTPAVPNNVFPTLNEPGHQFQSAVHQPLSMATGLQQPHYIFQEHQLGASYGYLPEHLQMEKTSVTTQRSRSILSNIEPDLNAYLRNLVNFQDQTSLQLPNRNVHHEMFNGMLVCLLIRTLCAF